MTDDTEEFFELSASEAPKRERGVIAGGLNLLQALAMKEDTDEDEEEEVGKLNQYSRMGSGFAATTSTVAVLPPACYRVLLTNNGTSVFNPQKLSTDSLLRLPDSKSDEVIAEVERFWTLKGVFSEFGFSHKRGFLLYGPPGSGKSSTVSLIIKSMISHGGVVFLANHPGTLAVGLHAFREVEPDRPLVVIWEDLDSVIDHYGESEVLSILDGESQVENIVIIATTNYPDKLDARITNRPSRFDKIVKIDVPNEDARKMYLDYKLTKHLPEGDTAVIADIVSQTDGFSIAHLRELIVSVYCQGNDLKETIERLKKMKVLPKPDRSSGRLGLGG